MELRRQGRSQMEFGNERKGFLSRRKAGGRCEDAKHYAAFIVG